MAIDKNKLKKYMDDIDALFDVLGEKLPEKARDSIKSMVLGPAIKEIEKIIEDSREPRMMIVGRSGHGKSSLINALAGKKIAQVNDIKPETMGSEVYMVSFPEYYSTWTIIDTRGIFDTTKPLGATEDDSLKVLEADIIKHKPDILMHVINIKELRAFSNDLQAFKRIRKKIEKKLDENIATFIVLTNTDTLGNPREWPLEEYPQKTALVKEALDYLTHDILDLNNSNLIDLNFPYKGYIINDDIYKGIIPVCALEGDYWNIDILSGFIGSHLPEDAKLNFFQGNRDIGGLKAITSEVIKRFSKIATGIGVVPIPIADIFILIPLQMLLITFIGAMSCRELKIETAHEYLAAMGLNLGAGMGAKVAAHQLLKIVPVGGHIISGAIAGSVTYGIGKSAELYFFDGIKKYPKDIKK